MAQHKKHNKPYNKNRNQGGNQGRNDRGGNNGGGRNNDNRGGGNRNNDNRNNNSEGEQKQGGKPKKQTSSKTESSNDLIIFIVFLIGLAGFFLVKKFYFPPDKTQLYGATANTKFMKEGKLRFLDAQTEEEIIGIDIEVATSSFEIEKGLMHRRSLPANGGMLFVFEEEYYRTFWMKDTYVALDIMFLNADKEIIRISKHTMPLSELSIPSGGKAMYVVEVLAGFTDAHQIHIGDHIEFTYR